MVGIKYLIKLHGNVLILSHKEFFQYDTSSSYENVKYLNMHQMIQITDDSSEFLSYSNSGKGKKKISCSLPDVKKMK